MNTVDLILFGLFVMGILYGYRKGLVRQAVGFLGLFISIIVAYSFSKHTAVFLQKHFPIPQEYLPPLLLVILDLVSFNLIYTLISFVLLFFLTRWFWLWIGAVFSTLAELPILSLFNRWLGACAGALQVLVVIIIGLNIVQIMPESKWKEEIHQSHLALYFLNLSPFLSEKLKDLPQRNELDPSGVEKM